MTQNSKRTLGLDVGTKRIGVAKSDALGIIAQPYETILRDNNCAEKIKKICVENEIKTIVVGLPINMDGSLGPQAQDCMEFSKHFEPDFDIIFEDERLTSSQAEDILRAQGKKYTRDKSLVDLMSSCIILQQYLDRK